MNEVTKEQAVRASLQKIRAQRERVEAEEEEVIARALRAKVIGVQEIADLVGRGREHVRLIRVEHGIPAYRVPARKPAPRNNLSAPHSSGKDANEDQR